MSEQSSDRQVVLKRVAENLRSARRRLGISQETLGILAGLHRTEIGMLENAERIPRIDTVVKLATVLDITVDQLVDGVDDGDSHRPVELRNLFRCFRRPVDFVHGLIISQI